MNNKITADHLARRACVYIRQSTPEQVKYNLESKRRQYGLADHAPWVGKTLKSSMTTWDAQERGLLVLALNACCVLCAKDRWVPSLALRRHDWRATAESGTRCWNFAPSSVPF